MNSSEIYEFHVSIYQISIVLYKKISWQNKLEYYAVTSFFIEWQRFGFKGCFEPAHRCQNKEKNMKGDRPIAPVSKPFIPAHAVPSHALTHHQSFSIHYVRLDGGENSANPS